MSATTTTSAEGVTRDIYGMLTGDEDARVCKDIPDESCNDQPQNFLLHLVALALTKTADAFINPKLVLPWLLSALGAPAAFTGLLVPLRESLALVPQMVVAGFIRLAPIRKWFWVGGAIGQAAAVAGMALVAASLSGAAAGWSIIGLLTVFALSRGVCSVASKDVMGKTVSKTRRGRVSGYASSVSGALALALGLWLAMTDLADQSIGFFVGLLAVAAGLWLLAAGVYTRIGEAAGATEGGGNAIEEALRQLRLLRTDKALRDFILVRAALMASALVAPFYVALAQKSGAGSLGDLGLLVIASGLASFLSAPIWGGFADRSTRKLLAVAGGLAGILGVIVIAAVSWGLVEAAGSFFFPAVIFMLAIAHQGIRLGRKTHLVDMATQDNRATYVALSNTVIGILLLAGGVFGLLAQAAGELMVIGVLSAFALAGGLGALALDEVQ
ncbi:MAG: MFS transporter [Alphaproteobacteria bacterium]